MEDTFRVRVDKTFNSLPSSSSSSSSSSQTLTPSLWCLTDEEIEKRQWTREPDASIPIDDDDEEDEDKVNEAFLASNVDKFFFKANDEKSMASENNLIPNPNPNLNELDFRKEVEDDLKELDDNGGEGCSAKSAANECREVVCGEGDELEVKKVIGMDCTLDFEEEEDGFDKVAVGTEKTGPRLYMSDVSEYTPDIDSYNELPNAFKEAARDPRANHLAAKRRLKEDAETAKSFNSLHVSDHSEDVVSGAPNDDHEDENLPKSILKRKDDHMDSKSGKRVRFEPTIETDDHSTSEGDKIVVSETSTVDNTPYKESSLQQHDSSLIPDHVRHPLRYTHYTFDSSPDMNEESNRQAYMDFLNMVKKSKSEPDEVPADLTKPIIFTPKKKAGDASMVTSSKSDNIEEPMHKKSFSVSIAAGIAEEGESSEMEVDEQETTVHKIGNGRRMARKYRSKVNLEPNS